VAEQAQAKQQPLGDGGGSCSGKERPKAKRRPYSEEELGEICALGAPPNLAGQLDLDLWELPDALRCLAAAPLQEACRAQGAPAAAYLRFREAVHARSFMARFGAVGPLCKGKCLEVVQMRKDESAALPGFVRQLLRQQRGGQGEEEEEQLEGQEEDEQQRQQQQEEERQRKLQRRREQQQQRREQQKQQAAAAAAAAAVAAEMGGSGASSSEARASSARAASARTTGSGGSVVPTAASVSAAPRAASASSRRSSASSTWRSTSDG
jgi:hypothetical protein